MKIITEDCAYVQKNDIAYLNSYDLPVPGSIYMKMYGNGVTIVNNSNRYEFVKFEAGYEIDFFKNLDWMVDYNEVNRLTPDELVAFEKNIIEEKDSVAEKFNDTANDISEEERKSIAMQYELLDFKLKSFRDIMDFNKGILPMELPEELYPSEKAPNKGFKKLLRKVISRK